MTIKDLMIEQIFLSGEAFVASAKEMTPYWTGKLFPGVEDGLRDEDGELPRWFNSMEIVAIGAADDGGLLIAVR